MTKRRKKNKYAEFSKADRPPHWRQTTSSHVRTCRTKHRFTCERHAREALPSIEARYGKKQRVYYCSVCCGFHTSSMTLEEVRAYRR